MRILLLILTLTFVTTSRAADTLGDLKQWLALPVEKREPLEKQPFTKVALSKTEAEDAQKLLWADHAVNIKQTRADEIKALEIKDGELVMKFAYKIYGEKPKSGRSLFISMHGGGSAAKEVNDQQWENQKLLYKPEEGVYLAPRAPTNTWNLWHEAHIDRMFARLIEDLIVLEDVDPNRVYIMGYSAGGDGTYQLAPRMADQLAAASMMAGHPNDASPLGLRNIAFSIQVGANDGGYNRNKIAKEWGDKLDALQKADPKGYEHFTKLHEGKGHWMDRQDAPAVPWMQKFTRNPVPDRVVWHQASTTHSRFYWLAVDDAHKKSGSDVVATLSKEKNAITIESSTLDKLILRVNDAMLDLDMPVTVQSGGQNVFQGKLSRTIETLAKTLRERGDPAGVFSAEVEVSIPPAKQ